MSLDNPLQKLQREVRRAKTDRAGVAGGLSRQLLSYVMGRTPFAGLLYFVTDQFGGIPYYADGLAWHPFSRLPNRTYSQLPSSADDGVTVYVTDGRKSGESAGAGTGVPAYFSGSNWYRFSDDTAVQN